MDWKLNASQKAVLDWLCTSPDGPPPSDMWKHAATALQGRGLVSISRSGGRYSVTVTDVGRHMHEHGEYPLDSAGGRQTRRREAGMAASGGSASSRSWKAPAKARAMARIPPVLSPDLASRRFVRPHLAVRSLRDRPVSLPADPAGRQRGLVAADLLVAAARESGIAITAHDQPAKRSPGSPYTGEPLMSLNAGSAEVVIRIGEYERRTEHVKIQDELDRESRYMYSWSRRWDYVPTGLLCLRLYSRLGTPTRLLETATKPLHEFVPRVIHLVQLATQKEIDLETARRERERREAERQSAARELARRREHYGRWEKVLLEGRESWERAQRLREFVHELERRSGAESSEFVTWALDYIDHLDPVESFAPPQGGPPDLSHAEEQQLRDRTAPALSDPWRR